MGVINQGPNVGGTTSNYKKYKPPVCWTCRERREGEIYGITPNGQPICATCREGKVSIANCDQDTK